VNSRPCCIQLIKQRRKQITRRVVAIFTKKITLRLLHQRICAEFALRGFPHLKAEKQVVVMETEAFVMLYSGIDSLLGLDVTIIFKCLFFYSFIYRMVVVVSNTKCSFHVPLHQEWGTYCICYHGPHEMCITAGGPQNTLVLSYL